MRALCVRWIARLRAMILDAGKRQRECKTLDDWRMVALHYESDKAAAFPCQRLSAPAMLGATFSALLAMEGASGFQYAPERTFFTVE